MGDVLVLCYHALSDDWEAPLCVPPARLEQQLAYLLERGYHETTFTEAVTAPAAQKTLAVTFDDGFRSVVEHALPILARLGLPGTVFVPTALVGRDTPLSWPGIDHWLGGAHEAELTPMSWEDVAHLAGLGWEVGSHTLSHPRLTLLDGAALARELEASRGECERELGVDCTSVAYPYGVRDSRVVLAARKAGYRSGAGLPERNHRARELDWPRIGIFRNDSFARFEAKVSRYRRHLIGSGAGEAILRRELRLRARLARRDQGS